MDNYEVREYIWVDVKKALRLLKHQTLKRGLREYIRQRRNGTFEFIDIS